jgi:hypothetical protein
MSEGLWGVMRIKAARIVCVFVLAATAAACDRCGDFIPPIRFQGDTIQVCRDEAPKQR